MAQHPYNKDGAVDWSLRRAGQIRASSRSTRRNSGTLCASSATTLTADLGRCVREVGANAEAKPRPTDMPRAEKLCHARRA